MDYPKDLILPELGAFPTEQALSDYVLGIMSEWFSIETEVDGRYRGEELTRIDAVLRPLDPSKWADESPAFGIEFKLPKPDAGLKDYFKWAAQAVDYTHVDWDGYGRLQVFVCPSPIMAYLSTAKARETARARRQDMETIDHARHWTQLIYRTVGEEVGSDLEQMAQDRWFDTVIQHQAEDAEAFAEGFQNALDRSEGQRAVAATAISHLLGQLNVGELMPTKRHGWSLIRAGHMLWCQDSGVRGKWSLKPQLGSR